MGRSKVAMFRDAVVDAALPLFDEVIAVQRHGGAPDARLRTIHEEPHELAAPVFGVVRALEDASDRAFILAVDYPFITTDALRLVRDHGAPFVVPEWDGNVQMLCGVYHVSLAPRMRARIAAGRLDLRGLLDEGGGEIIPERDLRARLAGEPLRNVNTPEELEEARRIHESRFLTSR